MPTAGPYDALLQFICVSLGFCGSVVDDAPRHLSDFIPSEGPVTADQFANWVFQAEGWDPQTISKRDKVRVALRAAFVEHMGGDVVDARRLH